MVVRLLSRRVLSLLKFQPSTKSARKVSETSPKQSHSAHNVSKCCCCGTFLLIDDAELTKYHCATCRTTILQSYDFMTTESISLVQVREMAALCLLAVPALRSEVRLSLRPLLEYLFRSFSSIAIVNNSFQISPRKSHSRPHYSSNNVNVREVRETFEFLAQLPSKAPLHSALSGCCEALRRLPLDLFDSPKNLYWLVMLLEIPFLQKALVNSDRRSPPKKYLRGENPGENASSKAVQRCAAFKYPMVYNSEIQSLLYEVLKRVLGVLAQTEVTHCGNYLASWLSKLPMGEFLAKVDLINLYITFHFKKHYYYVNNPVLMRREQERRGEGKSSEYVELSYIKDEVEHILQQESDLRRNSAKPKKTSDSKIKFHQYTLNYHLRTASSALGLLFRANSIRSEDMKLPIHAFYNSLVDYVNVKMDFDAWSSKHKTAKKDGRADGPDLQTVIDYIHGNGFMSSTQSRATYFVCQYPFLMSLGAKISILEYEARRLMERKAEEAFINSLDRRVALDVYFKVRVRREHIVQDLLLCIQLNGHNLKKSLRVQFVNEPGVDAGGLKKEWFLTLTRLLYSPSAGTFHTVEESNFLWFKAAPAALEKCYLFGAVLGLAIYNSTILDLNFPLSMYKILLGLPIGLADYQELYPRAAHNLFKLRSFSADDMEALDLAFEVNVPDAGTVHTVELMPNGSSTRVTPENVETFIDKYSKYHLQDSVEAQVQAFKAGFLSVVDGNAFSLFLPEEVQLLLCGSEQKKIDVDILKSVTCYGGWPSKADAEASPVVAWFWDYLKSLSFLLQKKMLLFITGSDRVPATGIQNLHLRISRLENGADSDRLPVAHTCFNELVLYGYGTREKLEKKLNDAVNMSAGFGLK